MKRGLMLLAGLMMLAGGIFADDPEIIMDEDALFGGEESSFEEEGLFQEEILVDMTEEAQIEEFGDVLLKTEAAVIGGKIGISTDTVADASDLSDNSTAFKLSSDLYLDARPYEDFRVFFKGAVSYPFTEDDERSAADIFMVKELFSDFQLGDLVFFRAGKQTVSWGVGYFFSPGDVINVSRIDPENPEEERTGPVSLKTHVPFSVNNAYLYLILEDLEEYKMPAIAPKAEFLAGSMEVGIGGYYLYDNPPLGMVTFTLPWRDFHFFGEGVLSYGSSKTFVQESDDFFNYPLGFSSAVYDDKLFFSGTAGFLYSYIDDDSKFNVSLAGQYYFNGQGYDDPSFITDNEEALGFLLAAEELAVTDFIEPGKHYGAATLSWSEILNSDFSFSTFWMGNFSDASGFVTPAFSYSVNDYISLSLGLTQNYGKEGTEFATEGLGTALTLSTSLGSGKF